MKTIPLLVIFLSLVSCKSEKKPVVVDASAQIKEARNRIEVETILSSGNEITMETLRRKLENEKSPGKAALLAEDLRRATDKHEADKKVIEGWRAKLRELGANE